VPEPQDTRAYIDRAADARGRPPLCLRRARRCQRQVLGSTSYHDIVPAVRAWRSATPGTPSVQRTHVNTTAKLLLMGHAFDTLGCHVVGWRTDNFNFASQRAIERLGARRTA
jgi:RimJ/RimL family protein N-acetyltransferase